MNPACSGQLSISVFRASVVPGAGRWPSGCSRGAGGVPSDGVWLVMDQAGNSWPARLWRHTSLMQRMAFVALVPTLITAGLLVTLLTQRQLVSLRRMAQTNADSIATQTASVSVQPLRAMRLRELMRIADSIGELPHVTRVQIRTADGQILADHRADDDERHEVMSVVRQVGRPAGEGHHHHVVGGADAAVVE